MLMGHVLKVLSVLHIYDTSERFDYDSEEWQCDCALYLMREERVRIRKCLNHSPHHGLVIDD